MPFQIENPGGAGIIGAGGATGGAALADTGYTSLPSKILLTLMILIVTSILFSKILRVTIIKTRRFRKT